MLWTEWYYSSYKWRNWSMIQTLEICHGYRPYYQFVHAVLFQRNVGDMWLSNVMLVLMLHVIIWSHVCRGIVITENLWRRICKNKIHTLQQQVTTTIINNTQTHTKLTTASLTISISNLPFISWYRLLATIVCAECTCWASTAHVCTIQYCKLQWHFCHVLYITNGLN